jgi:glycosyltransferase involved in cell wall biosynthesis
MRDFAAEVTPVILTRNEEANIARALGQLRWAREVVIVDSVSTDATVAIARTFPNVRVVERPFDDLAAQWTFALQQSSTAWVLALDADYFVSGAFADELRTLDPAPDVACYIGSFRYAIGGRPLRASLYPPRCVLMRRDATTFTMDGHTQRAHANGKAGTLREPLVHDDRKSFKRFIERQKLYMRDEAVKIRRGKNLNLAGRIRKLRVVAPFAAVFYLLVVKGLMFDGIAGLHYVFERFVAESILSIELLRPEERA